MGPRAWTSAGPPGPPSCPQLGIWPTLQSDHKAVGQDNVYSLDVQGPPEAWDLGTLWARMCWLSPMGFGDRLQERRAPCQWVGLTAAGTSFPLVLRGGMPFLPLTRARRGAE